VLIAVDLDGTLLAPDGQVSVRPIAALHAARHLGHEIVAVTGRSWRTCVDRLQPVTSINHIVCSNGAYCFHANERRVLWSSPISPESSAELTGRIRANYDAPGFGWESASGIRYDQTFIDTSPAAHDLESGGSSDSLEQQPLYKIYIRVPGLARGQLPHALIELTSDIVEITTSGASFVEASSLGTNKASGLATIAEALNISANDTIAFGDNLNDLPMLQWAGTSVAMGNAMSQVVAISDQQTETNAEDGVAAMIERMLL